jgi:hypothetical protein
LFGSNSKWSIVIEYNMILFVLVLKNRNMGSTGLPLGEIQGGGGPDSTHFLRSFL